MIKLKKVAVFALSAAMVTSLAACGGGNTASDSSVSSSTASTSKASVQSGEKVKLKFLSLSADDNRNKIRENYIKTNIAKEMPNVEVEYDLGGGGDDYANKLKAYNASGDMPDVWFSEQNLSSVVISAGNALDLASYVKNTGFDKKFAMKEVITPDADGKLYCVQSGSDQYFTPRLWYHKDIFTKNNLQVPKTFDELVKVCETLKSKGITPISIVGKGGWTPNLHMLQTMIMAEDPQVAVDLANNKTDFSNPVVKNALGRIQKLVKAGAFAQGVTNIDYGPAVEMYTSNKAAMLAMFTWELPNLEKASPDTDFMVWPAAKDGVDANASIQFWGAPLSGYLVAAKTKNPEVAAQFAMFCATQDALFYNTDNKAPTALETGVKIEGMSELAKKNLDQFNNAKLKIPSLWSAIYSTKMSAEITTLDSNLLTGDYSPDEFIKAINPIWAKNFSK
ncbi:extracellular solute-binding protein family 1 [Ruminiclostridium papyrosolvens DSM 2782]|uniref:Extracellular solute-binding protein family 1 n=1 Tax=Ruminiclostridium papyrosolvens DSM 2782 TaxID=588581 RepID=F1T9E2_9FIRM|nr:extracellular solute-binding protein [Ruminiclostridium papyrosolvens]EGD49124.1 extracellular solute-binding protein family 1 [Ruminiclostridium papyrosolvens DSM 2782]WES35602.1 extracellular solute-binding protein [Ruminiclostridium papyrosolvens DSM 2782]